MRRGRAAGGPSTSVRAAVTALARRRHREGRVAEIGAGRRASTERTRAECRERRADARPGEEEVVDRGTPTAVDDLQPEHVDPMRGEVLRHRREAPGPVGQAEPDQFRSLRAAGPGASTGAGRRVSAPARGPAMRQRRAVHTRCLLLPAGPEGVLEHVRVRAVRRAPAPLVEVRGEVLHAELVVGADEPADAGDDPARWRARRGRRRSARPVARPRRGCGGARPRGRASRPGSGGRRTRPSCSCPPIVRRSSFAESPFGATRASGGRRRTTSRRAGASCGRACPR